MKRDKVAKNWRITHGMSLTPIYKKWGAMHGRCSTAKLYIKRGITVSEDWGDFEAFYRDMGEGYKEGLTLDRIDNNKGYSKENCRWTTSKVQARNRSTNHTFEIDGKKMTVAELAELCNIPYKTFLARLNDRKWSIERAMKTKLMTARESGQMSALSPNHINNKITND